MTVAGLASGSNDLTLTSSSTIDEAGTGTATTDITTSGLLTLNAGGDIGASGSTEALDIEAGSLTVSTTGGIYLREDTGLTVGSGNVRTTANNGAIELTLDSGNLTLDGDITAHGSGTVAITLSGTGASLDTSAGTDNIASTSGAITITADVLNLSTGTIATGGALTLRPLASTTMGIGTAATGTFNLTDTELGLLSTGGALTLGRSDAGAVEVDSAYTFVDAVTVLGGAMTIEALSSGANDITLTSTSTIDEGTKTGVTNITTSGALTLNAGGAIGGGTGASLLETYAGMLTAHSSAAMYLAHTGCAT